MSQSGQFDRPPEKPRHFQFFVDGEWLEGREFSTRHSPSHDVAVSQIPRCSVEYLNDAVKAARRAFDERGWSGAPGGERAAVLLRAAEIMRRRTDEIAYWEVLENGKPFAQAKSEIAGCVACFEVAAGAARLLHGESFNNLGDKLFGMVLKEPIGGRVAV